MPLVKDREDRLKAINDRLQRWGGHPVSTSELARHCNVSESTIKQDIAYLKAEYDAPIAYCRKPHGYHYTRPFELAATVTLTDKDLAALHTAVATLQQFRHLNLFADLRGTVDKLDKAVRFRSSQADDFGRYILFESVPYTKGSECVSTSDSSAAGGAVSASALRYRSHENAPDLPVCGQGTPQSVVCSWLAAG
jgi:hypothetical protein